MRYATLTVALLGTVAPVHAQHIGGDAARLPHRPGEELILVHDAGPPDNRVNLVFIGDGYTEDELDDWAAHVDEMVMRMLSDESPPYDRYANFINIYRIDLVSNESGVDRPSRNVYVDTALDGCDCCIDWTIGECQVNWDKTHAAIDDASGDIDIHWRLVALNTSLFIGGTHYPAEGTLAVYSANNAESFFIMVHEAGHGFHHLQDEYHYAQYDDDPYVGAEPSAVNLTKNPGGAKWSEWHGFAQPHLGGPIGAYEGGLVVYGRDIYHPAPQCRMNGMHNVLDAVCQERAVHSIYEIVDPIDTSWPTTPDVTPDTVLRVNVIDPAVIRVAWRIDGELVGEGATLDLRTVPYVQTGRHVIEAIAFDEVITHAFSDNDAPHPLDLVRRDVDGLSQSVSWTCEPK